MNSLARGEVLFSDNSKDSMIQNGFFQNQEIDKLGSRQLTIWILRHFVHALHELNFNWFNTFTIITLQSQKSVY